MTKVSQNFEQLIKEYQTLLRKEINILLREFRKSPRLNSYPLAVQISFLKKCIQGEPLPKHDIKNDPVAKFALHVQEHSELSYSVRELEHVAYNFRNILKVLGEMEMRRATPKDIIITTPN